MKIYTLKKSTRKGKRFMLTNEEGKTIHFGSDVGSTFIDHQDEKKKKAWEARHRQDKGYNDKSAGIYYSKSLLWTEPSLKQAISSLEKKDNIKILYK
jgi:hypothetical protein